MSDKENFASPNKQHDNNGIASSNKQRGSDDTRDHPNASMTPTTQFVARAGITGQATSDVADVLREQCISPGTLNDLDSSEWARIGLPVGHERKLKKRASLEASRLERIEESLEASRLERIEEEPRALEDWQRHERTIADYVAEITASNANTLSEIVATDVAKIQPNETSLVANREGRSHTEHDHETVAKLKLQYEARLRELSVGTLRKWKKSIDTYNHVVPNGDFYNQTSEQIVLACVEYFERGTDDQAGSRREQFQAIVSALPLKVKNEKLHPNTHKAMRDSLNSLARKERKVPRDGTSAANLLVSPNDTLHIMNSSLMCNGGCKFRILCHHSSQLPHPAHLFYFFDMLT